ncbi:unnamed protein product [Prunus armeniaca]|uniref:Uncharacterized protein n=1 Tax=Prunus armeniaca TaxID=36596 RepID=A0A6J5Y3P9_PRUAR|nr:unnamed protein product [Prunus armeniaca]
MPSPSNTSLPQPLQSTCSSLMSTTTPSQIPLALFCSLTKYKFLFDVHHHPQPDPISSILFSNQIQVEAWVVTAILVVVCGWVGGDDEAGGTGMREAKSGLCGLAMGWD